MPRGLARYYGAGDLHFITCSCCERRAFLATPQRRDLFLQVLERMRRSYHFVVLGYVVMPEHFHLLICEPQRGNVSTVMQALKLSFTRRLRAEHRRRSSSPSESRSQPTHHMWQPRFYDFNVWTERKRIEKLRYMHRNPVQRGLVLEAKQWPWSSFRAHLYGEIGLVRINDCSVLRMMVRESAA
jgi:putative transposase